MIARALAIVVGAAAFCAALIPEAGADPAASRVIDETFSCSVRLWAGERRIDASATSGFRDPDRPSRWKWLPSAGVGGRDLNSYVYILAGAPPPQPEQGVPPRSWWWVGVDAIACDPARGRLPLSSRGLMGGQASQLQDSDSYDCQASRRVLVRVTARFGRPVDFRSRVVYERRRYATTVGVPAQSAAFTVATMTGKPLVYATVSETGKATLFTARNCVPD